MDKIKKINWDMPLAFENNPTKEIKVDMYMNWDEPLEEHIFRIGDLFYDEDGRNVGNYSECGEPNIINLKSKDQVLLEKYGKDEL